MRTFEQQNYYKLFCNKNENNEQLREYLRHFTDSRYLFYMTRNKKAQKPKHWFIQKLHMNSLYKQIIPDSVKCDSPYKTKSCHSRSCTSFIYADSSRANCAMKQNLSVSRQHMAVCILGLGDLKYTREFQLSFSYVDSTEKETQLFLSANL